MNEIYVTGHRNPDTDSIVAALSYAALKNALGEKEYVAVHMGTISDETNRMLKHFGFKPPRLIQNVRTQVRDLDFDRPPCLDSSVTMDRAWQLMRNQKISAIPVTNEDGTLYGMLSAGDIATFSLNTIANPVVEEVPMFNLLSVIEGRIVGEGGDLVDTLSGSVSIALPQNCENLLFDSSDSIVLCGSQPDMIRRALDMQVSCLILCQTDVDPEWIKDAGKTCIISTPFDASRVHRLIYQAIPISRPCATGDLICFHLDDYIDDVREVVLKSRYRCYPVLDEEEKVVGTLSHELKTPMTTIAGFADGILDGTIPKDQEDKYLATIADETRRLSRLVRSMLDMSRLESTGEDLTRRREFDISEKIVSTMLSFEARANDKQLDVDLQLPEDSMQVLADPDAITRVLYNLMDNGIKYSGTDGFVHAAAATDGDWVVLTVEDNGIGIPEDDLPHIFERFYRVDKMRSRAIGGTGLGLSIVKDTVENRGGSITAAARQGGGTVFTVRLPRAAKEGGDGQ